MKKYIIKDVGSCFDVYELLPNCKDKLVFIGFSKDDYTIDLVKKWLCSRYSGKYKIRPHTNRHCLYSKYELDKCI